MTRNGSDGGEGGFTLLEVILVVSIIGILATMGFPAFSNFIRDFRMDSFSNKMLSAMRNARFTAMSENRPVRVVVEMGESTQYGDDRISFEICSKSSKGGNDCPGDATFVQAPGMATLQPPEPIIIFRACNEEDPPYGTSTGQATFSFRPDGSAYGSNCGVVFNPPFIQITQAPAPDEENRCEFQTVRISAMNGLPKLFPYRRNLKENVNEPPLSDLECAQ